MLNKLIYIDPVYEYYSRGDPSKGYESFYRRKVDSVDHHCFELVLDPQEVSDFLNVDYVSIMSLVPHPNHVWVLFLVLIDPNESSYFVLLKNIESKYILKVTFLVKVCISNLFYKLPFSAVHAVFSYNGNNLYFLVCDAHFRPCQVLGLFTIHEFEMKFSTSVLVFR
jgi:hypothetical protein